jgi:hypothetical protein
MFNLNVIKMNSVVLTKQGKKVLINWDNVTNVETFNSYNGVLTKLFLMNGNYVMVEETMETIFETLWGMNNGVKPMIDWTEVTIDESAHQSYERQERPRRQFIPRDRYNNRNTYNENSY